MSTAKTRSLYVHFPFCEAKCHYCDFYSLGREKTKAGDALKFSTALKQEANLRLMEGQREGWIPEGWDTIFFGGGTPSMTPPAEMREALGAFFEAVPPAAGCEWTMEANPSSVTAAHFREYRAMGINRVSMGVQSLSDHHLERLGRVHSHDDVYRALDTVFSAGFENVSVDLLCGVPGQTLAELEAAMARLTSFPITHLSCYLLTLPKHHRMAKDLPSEDAQLEHYLLVSQYMRSRRFEHYEISNFARPGSRARHNLAYWRGEGYLGLGPSAHSYFPHAETRVKNRSSLHGYFDQLVKSSALAVESSERLNDSQVEMERWMLGLRLAEGIPTQWVESSDSRRAKRREFERAGWMEPHPSDETRVRLTTRGFVLMDQIVASLL